MRVCVLALFFLSQCGANRVDASQCVVKGQGISHAVVGARTSFDIVALDSKKNKVADAKFEVTFSTPKIVEFSIVETSSGATVKYLKHAAGSFNINVAYNGTPLPGSPFRVHALEQHTVKIRRPAPGSGGLPFSLTSAAPVKDQAFAAMVTDENYVVGALVLAHSLQVAGTTRSLVCIVTSGISAGSRELLSHAGWHVLDVPLIPNPVEDAAMPLWRTVFTKLHLWSLTQYKKIVYLDSDIVVLRNMDELFGMPELSAVMDCCPPSLFNSGVLVLDPSKATYDSMLQMLPKMGSFDGGDQGFLNLYFNNKWQTLPYVFNFLKYDVGGGFNFFTQHMWKAVYAVHFIQLKPWWCHRSADCNEIAGGLNFAPQLYPIWWEAFDALCATDGVTCLENLANGKTKKVKAKKPSKKRSEL